MNTILKFDFQKRKQLHFFRRKSPKIRKEKKKKKKKKEVNKGV